MTDNDSRWGCLTLRHPSFGSVGLVHTFSYLFRHGRGRNRLEICNRSFPSSGFFSVQPEKRLTSVPVSVAKSVATSVAASYRHRTRLAVTMGGGSQISGAHRLRTGGPGSYAKFPAANPKSPLVSYVTPKVLSRLRAFARGHLSFIIRLGPAI